MARSDQYIGLNDWARALVHQRRDVREVGDTILPNGDAVPFDRKGTALVAGVETIGEIVGAFSDCVAHLSRYTLPDGRVFDEFVQAEPWSSGPCYFIALKDGEGNEVAESLWSDEEIDNA